MSNEDETRKQVEEDAKEDLELEDEDADKVGGQRKAGKGQQEFLVIKMNDVIVTGVDKV